MKCYQRNNEYLAYLKGTDLLLVSINDNHSILKLNTEFNDLWIALEHPVECDLLSFLGTELLSTLLQNNVLVEMEIDKSLVTIPKEQKNVNHVCQIVDIEPIDQYQVYAAGWPFSSDS